MMHSLGAAIFVTSLTVVFVFNVDLVNADDVCHKTLPARNVPTMDRSRVTQKILSAKVKNEMKWSEIAAKIGRSKEWTTAALLGQMTLSREQASIAKELFDLTDEETAWLQIVPFKGSFGSTPVPSDPLIYRWYEMINVYGTTIKELIHEEFGDGIMSAIDFSMKIDREQHPKGDRVNVVLSGKFLPYKDY
uniref:Cyanate hydratase n=1 Tax=Plectus sambesii TaxID=2011161 RepID=A0A914V2X5_9BILA